MKNSIRRRDFVRTAALTAGSISAANAASAAGVAIILDPAAASAPVVWAANELAASLAKRGVAAEIHKRLADAGRDRLAIMVVSGRDALKIGGVHLPDTAEALALAAAKINGRGVLLAAGSDARGLVYALLELNDRVRMSNTPLAALEVVKPIVEKPANAIRGVSRLFCSDVEDKPWFHSKEMWPEYLTLLATQRFNRFHLAFGIGYDFLRSVTDAYFLFAYPFFLSVPGYNVKVPQLPPAERDKNLEMLRAISEQTVARGMEFQLGIWTHGYEWINSPNPNYTIEGLTKENHAAYSRDAIRALLQACPAITGVTFRVHGESGVEEGSYDFWKTVFEGVTSCGRKVNLDMHSKGMDQTMLDLGVSTGLPLTVSPKYWAEHMGMTYHQTDIRELERPRPGRIATGLMNLSTGTRSFTRYGYADLMREDRRWGVLHRIWPGTQRLLLWGDPLTAAAHSRAFQFCNSDGVEIMEPLSFKGRRGSGIAGNRCGYADATLAPKWDWQKYEYSLRVWGRMLYNPDSPGDVWQRYLSNKFGTGAQAAGDALANASRILGIVTTAHGASAANNTYWPELYTNQPMIESPANVYGDTPTPRVFGNVSPFDPQLFYRINDYAADLSKDQRSGKFSPIEVAQWIEDYAAAAAKNLAIFESSSNNRNAEQRRLALDVAIQAGLGRFFGAKFRAGVLYGVYEQTGSRAALDASLKQYRAARAAWAGLANRAKDAYVSDLTVGERPFLRGHWLDRLPAIDADIAALEKKLNDAKPGAEQDRVARAIQDALGRPNRPAVSARHSGPKSFQRTKALQLEISFAGKPSAVRLYYRHVNQAERYESVDMEDRGGRFLAAIPAAYTATPFPIAYYFEVTTGANARVLYPGLGPDLIQQPYYVVRMEGVKSTA